MEDQPRKATDILLELEAKLNGMVESIKSLDHGVKLVSNKLNDLSTKLDGVKNPLPTPKVEIAPSSMPFIPPVTPADPERAIPIFADPERNIPMTDTPEGFRRTSRPETYVETKPASTKPLSGDSAQRPPQQPVKSPDDQDHWRGINSPIQQKIPQAPPQQPLIAKPQLPAPQQITQTAPVLQGGGTKHQVMQRCVDQNGKSLFMANVEITDVETNQQMAKTRTSANGKWEAVLPSGSYKISILKQGVLGPNGKEKIESLQTITVSDSSAPQVLPMAIIKAVPA